MRKRAIVSRSHIEASAMPKTHEAYIRKIVGEFDRMIRTVPEIFFKDHEVQIAIMAKRKVGRQKGARNKKPDRDGPTLQWMLETASREGIVQAETLARRAIELQSNRAHIGASKPAAIKRLALKLRTKAKI